MRIGPPARHRTSEPESNPLHLPRFARRGSGIHSIGFSVDRTAGDVSVRSARRGLLSLLRFLILQNEVHADRLFRIVNAFEPLPNRQGFFDPNPARTPTPKGTLSLSSLSPLGKGTTHRWIPLPASPHPGRGENQMEYSALIWRLRLSQTPKIFSRPKSKGPLNSFIGPPSGPAERNPIERPRQRATLRPIDAAFLVQILEWR
jgi:hypothetical protein